MKKIRVNLVYNAMYQFLLVALPILTIPYLSRVLGPKPLGINGYVGSIVAFAGNFMLLGLNQFGVRTIAQAKADEISSKFRDLWIVQIATGALIVLIYMLATSIFLPYKIYFYLNIPYLIGYGLDISWAYIGLGNVKKVVLRNSIVKILSVLLIFTLVHNPHDLWKYVTINSVGMLLANFVFIIDLKSIGIKLKEINWREVNKRYLRPLIVLAVPVVAAQLYTNIDSTIVGTFSGVTQLAYYDQSQKIARIILAILTSVSTVIMPKMAQLDQRGSQSKLFSLFKTSADYTLLLSLLFSLILMVNTESFIPFFFGEAFTKMNFNMFFVSLIIIFIAYGGVFSTQLALSKGLYKEYTIPYVVGAVFSIVANLIVVPQFKADGGTVVIVTTEFIVCVLRIFLVRHAVDLKLLFKEHIKYVLVFLILLFAMRFVHIGAVGSFANLAITSIITGVLFILLLIVFRTRILSDFKRIFIKTAK
ncbi:oligosaccharide flippase family protein [Lapidilactobacillus mulanensis]|uniref:Oligosaccharide flippase family protein n=1 Tax=Lapidilactobacillus mulanensis TaxID=2485999 RepID=A0ABW4DQL4_9LACO|nr:oligosaccharide flippase family protein [Lapidilactobacillus mulanensis]